MSKYTLSFTKSFRKKVKSISKTDKKLSIKIDKVLQLLELDPKNYILHSHQVNSKNFGRAWSSSVTGDIRIIWNYDQNNVLTILLLNIGSHSGNDKVYK